MPDQIPAEVVSQRYARLVEVVNAVAWEENKLLVGTDVEVLVSTGEGRKDSGTGRLTGRARDMRLVHLDPQVWVNPTQIRVGDVVTAEVTYAAPHHLIADRSTHVRHTAAGDSCASGQTPGGLVGAGVSLGMPTVR